MSIKPVKYRIWASGKNMNKNIILHETNRLWIRTIDYIHKTYDWDLIIVYNAKENKELGRYYNFDNKKTYPKFVNELD